MPGFTSSLQPLSRCSFPWPNPLSLQSSVCRGNRSRKACGSGVSSDYIPISALPSPLYPGIFSQPFLRKGWD